MPREKVIYGYRALQGKYVPTPGEKTALSFCSSFNQPFFRVNEKTLFQHLLLLGSSGCGKTNTLNLIYPQIRNRSEAYTCIIFDTKGDYFNHPGFFRQGDCIIGNDHTYRDQSTVWNIFEEILADGEDPRDYEANAREIATILFKDRISAAQPFFANAARDLFAAALICFVRRAFQNPAVWYPRINNAELYHILMKAQTKDFETLFKRHEDFQGLLAYLGDGNNSQALGVLAELRSMLMDCFQGVFRQRPTQENGFSIRKAVRQKRRRAVFIEYDISLGESMTPVYRLLVDLALKEALGQSNRGGNTFFFLDELKLLPKITHLEDALNFGRSKGVCVMAGLQSVDQMYALYGRERGQAILGGFGSLFAFRTSDADSMEYVTRLLGTNVVSYRYYNLMDQPIDRERDGNTVEPWDQRILKTGEAIISLSSQAEPFLFCFGMEA